MKLTVKNKEYGLSWGMGAWELVCDKLGCDMFAIELGVLTNDQKYLNHMAYAAIRNWCKINEDDEDAEPDFSYRVFLDWMDNAPQEIADKIADSFMKSMFKGRTMEAHFNLLLERYAASTGNDGEGEGGKEQATKKKSRSAK